MAWGLRPLGARRVRERTSLRRQAVALRLRAKPVASASTALNSLKKIVHDIVEAIDQRSSVWRKWDGPREPFLKSAALCWIPVEDLLEFLNGLPGPRLTKTDVEQRLRAFHEEPYEPYPNDDLRCCCLALYAREKAAGTEMPAIVGALQEFVEREEQRLRDEHQAAWRQCAEEERIALEQRFLSGADCRWTPIQKSKEIFRRINGRAYKLSPTKDKKWVTLPR